MNTYKDFTPTAFDRAGAFLPERQDWIVAPVGQTRDRGALAQSNFAAALEILGGESDTVEVHRFGHWGPGWFEIILVHPSRANEVEEIEDRLENYLILDEDDFSSREWEEACTTWEFYGLRDRIEVCRKSSVSIFAARHNEIPSGVDTYLLTER